MTETILILTALLVTAICSHAIGKQSANKAMRESYRKMMEEKLDMEREQRLDELKKLAKQSQALN